MDIRAKINLSKYFFLTASTTFVCLLLCKNINEVSGVLIIYAATIVNHYMLLYIAEAMFSTVLKDMPVNKTEVAIYGVLKLLVLFLGLYLGVQLMKSRVIIPLLNYVVHIFILALSAKRSS